jgi:predicted ArsR family transcriptional regulator
VEHKSTPRIRTRERVVALLRERPSGLTIAELAAALDLKPNAVRKHLVALAQAGQVTAERLRPASVGRPATRYRAVDATSGDHAHRALAHVLLKAVGRLDAGEIEHAAFLAGHPRALEETLASLGFAPANVSSASQAAAGYKAIELRACPYLDLVAEPRGELICAFHRGLVRRDAPVGAALEEFHVAPKGPRCRIVLSGVAALPEGADRDVHHQ